MTVVATGLLRAASLAEVRAAGRLVVHVDRETICLFADGDEVHAVDNRCPHMGFPLHLGSLCDGILTCHWHHARFDICSGGTFDPWADDVPSYEVILENGDIWVNPHSKLVNDTNKYKNRLREGLQQNIGIV